MASSNSNDVSNHAENKFKVGDAVRVKFNDAKGAHRIPRYVRGKVGRVAACYGQVSNPLDHVGIYSPLYSIAFEIGEARNDEASKSADKVTVDVHEDSLEPVTD